MDNPIQTSFPTVCNLLSGRSFEKDIQKAAELAVLPDGTDRLKEELKRKRFSSNRLMLFLACRTFLNQDDFTATGLEQDLQKLAGRIDLPKLHAAYKDKLLEDKQFDDTVYEIAVAGICADFFDPTSLALEQQIASSRSGKKNSDLKGVRAGARYRVEVTVLHDEWPPRMDEDFQEIMEQARIEAGYTLALARPIASRESAEGVKRLVEELDAARRATPCADLTVQGVGYLFCEGEYRPRPGTSIIDYIQFDDTTPLRLVGGPAVSRNTVDPQEWKKVTNPKGVVTSMDVKQDASTHRSTPVSTKVWQTLQQKLGQCEPDHINIVAIGLPNPIDDNEVLNALTGSVLAQVEYEEDESGRRVSGAVSVFRLPSGPFVPADQSEDPEQFVDAFHKLSAVWLIRFSASYPRSALILNPNASRPLEESEAVELARLGRDRARAGQSAQAPTSLVPTMQIPGASRQASSDEQPPANTDEDVRRELAVELIGNCGSLADALKTISRLEDMRSAGERGDLTVQAGPGVTVDPLDIAEEFVDCCGGFGAARSFLESLNQPG